jgi:hypothetical protein
MGGIPIKFGATLFPKDEYQACSGIAAEGTIE